MFFLWALTGSRLIMRSLCHSLESFVVPTPLSSAAYLSSLACMFSKFLTTYLISSEAFKRLA